MAIAFVGSTTFYTGTSNTETINISLPNISNGDLWIVYYVEVAFTGTPTFEAGWQQLGTTSAPGGQLGATYILYRIREAGDNTTFVTTYPVGFGRQVCACAYGYSGTATNFPFDTDAIRDPFDVLSDEKSTSCHNFGGFDCNSTKNIICNKQQNPLEFCWIQIILVHYLLWQHRSPLGLPHRIYFMPV